MFLKMYTGVFAKRQQGLMKILWQEYKAAPGTLSGGQKAWAGLSWSSTCEQESKMRSGCWEH